MANIIQLREWNKLEDFLDTLSHRHKKEVNENTAQILLGLANQAIEEANQQGVKAWIAPKVKNHLFLELSKSRNQSNPPVKFSKQAEEKIVRFIKNN